MAGTAGETTEPNGAELPPVADVTIAGGGLAGLLLALALKSGAPDLQVEVIDARPPGSGSSDERASAVAAAARRMLDALGVWEAIAGEAQPILRMEVTDSRADDVARPVFLTFDEPLEDGAPFALMVPNGALLSALCERTTANGVVVRASRVTSFATRGGAMEVALEGQPSRRTRLLVAADGVRSRLRSLAGIRTAEWRYPQVAIVTTVAHEVPHEGTAWEHFLPAGPFAILPLKGNRSSLVWTEEKDLAERLLRADDFVFLAELESRFGTRLGRLALAGPRQSYPLSLTLARDYARERFALLGDAAHGIHPIAGQGLNLAFRDAAALAEVVVDAHRLGRDIGALDVLQDYERWRRFDTLRMGATTDVLNRLFSNDLGPLRAIRDVGLGLVDRLPGLKRFFIAEAAGTSGALPRLMRGEAL